MMSRLFQMFQRNVDDPVIKDEPTATEIDDNIMQPFNQDEPMAELNIPSHTTEPIIQTAPIFSPTMHDPLTHILNKLDPKSFVKFTKTCKHAYEVCTTARGIKVPFGRYGYGRKDFRCIVMVDIRSTRVDVQLHKVDPFRYRPGDRHPFSEKEIQGLLKMPFIFEIWQVIFTRHRRSLKVDSRVVEEISSFLRRFPQINIDIIRPTYVKDWDAFPQFIQEFGAKRIQIEGTGNVQIPMNLLTNLMSKVEDFEYDEYVPHRLILSATSKRLRLPRARISANTFKELLKKYAAGEISNWNIGRHPYLRRQHFIEACSHVMPVVTEYVSNWEPGFLYSSQSRPKEFRLRRIDGSEGKVSVHHSYISFR